MRYVVAGGRDFNDHMRLFGVLDQFANEHKLRTVISGCAKGVDTLAIEWAEDNDCWCLLEKMPADWNLHGKAAGPIRNQQMAQAADGLIVFWDGRSRGTKDMIEKATRCSLEVHIYRYKQE